MCHWHLVICLLITGAKATTTTKTTTNNAEMDDQSSRKILGSSVVTSVSVVMETGNGKHTFYADALGHPLSKPHAASQVASPINLLNPDRYEFYTFNDEGELVKRLMTLEEIQGIIAGGDSESINYNSENSPIINNPENDVSGVVENVQNVLKEEIESHKNPTVDQPIIDTPDVSSTWNMILPAFFGDGMVNDAEDNNFVSPHTKVPSSTEYLKVASRTPENPETNNLGDEYNLPIEITTMLSSTESRTTPITINTNTKPLTTPITISTNTKPLTTTTTTSSSSTYNTSPITKTTTTEKVKLTTLQEVTTSSPTEDILTFNPENLTTLSENIDNFIKITTPMEIETETKEPENNEQGDTKMAGNITNIKTLETTSTKMTEIVPMITKTTSTIKPLTTFSILTTLSSKTTPNLTTTTKPISTTSQTTTIKKISSTFTPVTLTKTTSKPKITTTILQKISSSSFPSTNTQPITTSTSTTTTIKNNSTTSTTQIPLLKDNSTPKLTTLTANLTTTKIPTTLLTTPKIVTTTEKIATTSATANDTKTTAEQFVTIPEIENRFQEILTTKYTKIDTKTNDTPSQKNVVTTPMIITTTTTTTTTTTNKPEITTKNITTSTSAETITMTTEELLTSTTETTETIETTTPEIVSINDSWKLVETVKPPESSTIKILQNSPTFKPSLEPYPTSVKVDLSTQGTFEIPIISEDMFLFSKLYNELALKFWNSLSLRDINSERSAVVSPFGAISMLAMIFLGARGGTNNELNDVLKLDDIFTFNPHLVFKEVTDSIVARNSPSAIVRELYSDSSRGKVLDFYKERVRYFYDGHVEEIDFRRIHNVIRRRTNALISKQTRGQLPQYLEETTLSLRGPLAALSTNIFQADCSQASTDGRDGELYFIVLPSIRQRRLVPIPAAVWRSGFIAGYDPELDATAVSLGNMNQAISTIFVMPGQQGHSAPGDVLLRLEARLLNTSYIPLTWNQLLKSMLPRPGLEIQLPRFLHKSVINTTEALKRIGLQEMFTKNKANFQGLNGKNHDLYFSDLMQINEFSICGDSHQVHTEIYPSVVEHLQNTNEQMRNFKYMDYFEENEYDKYLSIPLPLRPRQARLPEVPRLRFDRPFLYFVRHNPTGLILHMGRFNPKLLT